MSDATREVAREDWHAEARRARHEGYAFFDVLTAVDLEGDGFEVVLRVWDVARRTGLLVRTRCPRDDARVPTLVDLYAGAAWHERAVAELFGIAFDGHDTAPLLLPPDLGAHPLRKDFVLAPGHRFADRCLRGT